LNANGGDFYGPDGKFEMKGYPVKVKALKHAYDRESARKLWEHSEKLTSLVYS
jgi:hypothetical protein